MSWIHRDDMVEMFVNAIRNPKYSGKHEKTVPPEAYCYYPKYSSKRKSSIVRGLLQLPQVLR